MRALFDPLVALTTTVLVGMTLAAGVRAGRRSLRRRIGRAAHELRRPLQALALGVDARQPDQRLRDAVELASTALADLEQLVAPGRSSTRRALLDVRELVGGVVERARLQAHGRRLALRWTGPDAVVYGDAIRLAQAADNLVANALVHAEGDVVVDVAVVAERLRMSVRDGGMRRSGARGAPGHVDLPAGLARDLPGARRAFGATGHHGHGLAVVEEVASSHGGRFVLHRADDGSTAILELPLAARFPMERVA